VVIIVERTKALPQFWTDLMMVVYLLLVILQLPIALSERCYHDLGHILTVASCMLEVPPGLTVIPRLLMKLGPALSVSTIPAVTFVFGTFAEIIAGGALTWHQCPLVLFPFQFGNQFWSKLIVSRTPWSAQFFIASLLQQVIKYIQTGSILWRLLRTMVIPLLPVIQQCPRLYGFLADFLLIDQPVWKALMIVEKRCIINSHMLFGDSIATTLLFMVAACEHIIDQATSYKPPFSTEKG